MRAAPTRAGRASATLWSPIRPFTSEPPCHDQPRTIVEKIWDDHVVAQDPGAPAVLAVDLHLVHEVTSPRRSPGCAPAA